MKKGLAFLTILALFIACSDDDDKTVEEEAVEEEIIEQPTDNPDDDSEVETDPVSITATIPTWHHNRQVAVCLTFDDGCENQFTIAQPILDEYDVKASFYIVFSYPNYTYLRAAIAAGHEIGCHTLTYSNLTEAYSTAEEMEADFATCKELMNDNLGVPMLTLAYPNCVNPGNYDLLEKYFVAARTCDCRVDNPTPSDYMNISSWAIGDVTTYQTAESVENIIKKGLTTTGGGWVTILIHEIDTGSGYSPFSSEELRGVVEFLVANSDIYYVDTFANIARYTKERDVAQVSATMTDDQIVVTLTCNLDEEIYNVPISIEVPLPESWTTVNATQNGTAIDAEIVDNTIIFEAVPNGSEVVITE